MNFRGQLDSTTKARVEECNSQLTDASRLAALARTRLFDTPNELAFDRLALLAAKILNVPLTIVSLVGDKKQFFKAGFGLPSPYDVGREVPIDDSICRYTLAGHELIAGDTRQDPLLKFHPTVASWEIAAFIAIPMVTESGHVLGAFCAVDAKPREWSEADLLVMRELTASVMTEIRLREKIHELEAERELRDRFVMTLTHDLRTPIGITKIAAELLRDNSGFDTARAIKMILDNVGRADQMIQDLLNASALKAGRRLSLELVNCDLAKLIDETVQSLSALHGPRFQVRASSSASGLWDAKALRRVFENLLNNAVKYGAKGELISINARHDQGVAIIEIHNSGEPIPVSEIPGLFGAFQRAKSAQAGHEAGWGLGLTLVKGFVESHGGSVRVVSTRELGTVFTIELPLDARIATTPAANGEGFPQ